MRTLPAACKQLIEASHTHYSVHQGAMLKGGPYGRMGAGAATYQSWGHGKGRCAPTTHPVQLLQTVADRPLLVHSVDCILQLGPRVLLEVDGQLRFDCKGRWMRGLGRRVRGAAHARRSGPGVRNGTGCPHAGTRSVSACGSASDASQRMQPAGRELTLEGLDD